MPIWAFFNFDGRVEEHDHGIQTEVRVVAALNPLPAYL
jgi:hypothetical protein